jgi:hypothetical protein
MTSKRLRVTGVAAPPGADNFQILEGIGPGIERRLHSAGILTYMQLAALSPAEVARLVADVAGMSAERIANWDWVGQASGLAANSAASVPTQDMPAPSATETYDEAADKTRQHIERFRVELLLDEDNKVRRTRVAHVQSSGDDTWDEAWAGWKNTHLLNFIVQRALRNLQPTEPSNPVAPPTELALLSTPAVEPAVLDAEVVEPALPSVAAVDDSQLAASRVVGLAGRLRLTALDMLPGASAASHGILPYGQPFDIRIVLDFSDVSGTSRDPLGYVATVYAKSLRSGSRRIIAEERSAIVPAADGTITLRGTTPPQGIYRLEATVALTLEAAKIVACSDLVAFVEGGSLQIC